MRLSNFNLFISYRYVGRYSTLCNPIPLHSVPSILFKKGVCFSHLHFQVHKLQDCFLSPPHPSSHSSNANFPHVLNVPTKEIQRYQKANAFHHLDIKRRSAMYAFPEACENTCKQRHRESYRKRCVKGSRYIYLSNWYRKNRL